MRHFERRAAVHQALDKVWGRRAVESALDDLDELALEEFYGSEPVAIVSAHVLASRRAADEATHAAAVPAPIEESPVVLESGAGSVSSSLRGLARRAS